MKVSTVKGMNDYLPSEVALRDFLQSSILKTYQESGFERIMTPAIEDIENLDKSEGGDNLNLIFKILKRGEKLTSSVSSGKLDELADMGLRYDLTLPLSRYFANNKEKIVPPAKFIQIDKVYRAERPQKGRLREFVQCDIDILGSQSINCEIELIHVTAKALLEIGFKNFTVKINDRRILRSILISLGFSEDSLDSVCITFDKFGKVGTDGIKTELTEKGYSEASINKLLSILSELPLSIEKAKTLCTEQEAASSLETIINSVKSLSCGKYEIAFDISLVRGQGYYTGTVFEIETNDFKDSIAGGGRYDNLIGKFINEKVPAVGFSIGFERIFYMLSESKFTVPNKREKVAVLYDGDFVKAYEETEKLRTTYDTALFEKPKKVGKFLNRLQESGYFGFYTCGQSEEVSVFNK